MNALAWFRRLLGISNSVEVEPTPLQPLPPVTAPVGFENLSVIQRIEIYFGKLSDSQKSGVELFLRKWNESGLTDIRWLAYIFATSWHETAKTMQPIVERGAKSYFKKYEFRKDLGNIHAGDGYLFRGRGYPQLTGRRNHEVMSKETGHDLVGNPELLLVPDIAWDVMLKGMTKGLFTGKRLDQYFNDKVDDPVGARKIINGLDKAGLIAAHHMEFLRALKG